MNWTKKLENFANIAIVILAITLTIILAKKYFLPQPAIQSIQVGETVSIDGLNFNKADKTILIALQPDCPFCSASASFYRQLKEKTSSNNIHLAALFS